MTLKCSPVWLSVLAVWVMSHTGMQARDDLMLWNWLSLNLWENAQHKVHTYSDNRLVDDASEENLWLMSLRYKYKARQNLQLGLGYTYLDVRNLATDSWTHQQRLEFEVNPSFQLNDDWKLGLRNRMEVRYYENRADSSARFRHRAQLSRPVDVGPVSSYYTNIELFYLMDLEDLNEVRTIPVGTGITLGDQTRLNLFYMIQSKRLGRSSSWRHGHALGTNLIVTF